MAAYGIEISGLQNDNELHDINDDYKPDDGGIDELYDSSWEDEMIDGGIFHEDILKTITSAFADMLDADSRWSATSTGWITVRESN